MMRCGMRVMTGDDDDRCVRMTMMMIGDGDR